MERPGDGPRAQAVSCGLMWSNKAFLPGILLVPSVSPPLQKEVGKAPSPSLCLLAKLSHSPLLSSLHKIARLLSCAQGRGLREVSVTPGPFRRRVSNDWPTTPLARWGLSQLVP